MLIEGITSPITHVVIIGQHEAIIGQLGVILGHVILS